MLQSTGDGAGSGSQEGPRQRRPGESDRGRPGAGAAAQVWATNSRGRRGTPLTSRGKDTALREETLAAGLPVSCAPERRGARPLVGFPHLAEGFLQLLPVGCVAPPQALQLLIFFLVQDPQEILQFWKAEGFPLGEKTKKKNARCSVLSGLRNAAHGHPEVWRASLPGRSQPRACEWLQSRGFEVMDSKSQLEVVSALPHPPLAVPLLPASSQMVLTEARTSMSPNSIGHVHA